MPLFDQCDLALRKLYIKIKIVKLLKELHSHLNSNWVESLKTNKELTLAGNCYKECQLQLAPPGKLQDSELTNIKSKLQSRLAPLDRYYLMLRDVDLLTDEGVKSALDELFEQVDNINDSNDIAQIDPLAKVFDDSHQKIQFLLHKNIRFLLHQTPYYDIAKNLASIPNVSVLTLKELEAIAATFLLLDFFMGRRVGISQFSVLTVQKIASHFMPDWEIFSNNWVKTIGSGAIYALLKNISEGFSIANTVWGASEYVFAIAMNMFFAWMKPSIAKEPIATNLFFMGSIWFLNYAKYTVSGYFRTPETRLVPNHFFDHARKEKCMALRDFFKAIGIEGEGQYHSVIKKIHPDITGKASELLSEINAARADFRVLDCRTVLTK